MAHLRIAAGESLTRIADWIYVAAAARAAEVKAGRDRFGAHSRSPQPKRRCSTFGQLLSKQRLRIAAEAADSAQRDVADDAGDAEILIVDESVGELLVGPQIRANEAGQVIDSSADLPALHDLLECGKPFLEPAAIGLPLENDFGEHVHGPREAADLDHGLVSSDDA